jgi:hypothetical protein
MVNRVPALDPFSDTLYQEDKSKVRTRSGPRIMAALRNLAIGALHLAGRTVNPPGESGDSICWESVRHGTSSEELPA